MASGALASSTVFLDFETYYSTKDKYTLANKKLSMMEYILDPRFKAHGVGLIYPGEPPRWVSGPQVESTLKSMPWGSLTLCAHNVKFDGAILAWKYGIAPKSYIDTKSMSYAVHGTLLPDHSLETVSAHYGFPPKLPMRTDGIRDLTTEQEREIADRAIHDAELCRMILQKMMAKFPAGQLPMLDWTIQCYVHPRLCLDQAILRRLNEDERERRKRIVQAAYEMVLDDVPHVATSSKPGHEKTMFASNDQFSALLKRRGFEVPMKNSPTAAKKGERKLIPALAVGDSAFQDMMESGNEELSTLCEARVAAKSNTLETRSERYLKVAPLGPWPFDMNFSGAKQTHRGSGAPGAGGNPQNLRKCQDPNEHKSGHQCNGRLREAVCAPEGWFLGVADYAQIELRIEAWLAFEVKLMQALMEGRSPYAEFASKKYGRPITKADKKAYEFGKSSILGLGYGMGKDKFVYKIKVDTGQVISLEESEATVDLYRSTYDRIPAYWRSLERMIPVLAAKQDGHVPNAPFLKVRNGEIILPSGLPLRYPNLREIPGNRPGKSEWVYDVYKAGSRTLETTKLYGGKLLENICQALAGEIKKLGISRMWPHGIRGDGEVHDEILAALRAREDSKYMRQAMEAPIPWWPALPLKAEIGVGQNWLSAKA